MAPQEILEKGLQFAQLLDLMCQCGFRRLGAQGRIGWTGAPTPYQVFWVPCPGNNAPPRFAGPFDSIGEQARGHLKPGIA
jgi:hypothetical protein